MGLDMYLSAEKYVSGWDHNKDEAKASFAKVLDAVGLDSEDIASGAPSGIIRLNVMYWCKANAIHAWFVKNVQNSTDDCDSYYVNRDDLKSLSQTCRRVAANKDLAPTELPTQSGFFFGPTEYDDCYIQELVETADRIDQLLSDPKFEKWDFKYQSSW